MVVKGQLAAETTLDAWTERTVERLEADARSVKPVTHRRITLPAGEAEVIRYVTGEGATQGEMTMYSFVQGADMLALWFIAPSSQAEGYAAVFEEIARSLEFIER